MPNAKDYSPARDGITVNVIGEPKAGKSHFARSAASVGKVFALLAPEELPGYAGHDIEYEIIQPAGWERVPPLLEALKKRDDVKVLVVDTANAVLGDPLWRHVLKGYNVTDPRDLGGRSRDPYLTYGLRMEELLNQLLLLRYEKKMHVIALWHQDIREFEGLGTPRKEDEKVGGGSKTVVHWDLARVPMARGAIRQIITKWFDFSVYVEPVIGSKPHRSRLIPVPTDMTRTLAGVRLDVLGELQKLNEVPNDFGKLVEVVAKRYGQTQ